MAEHTPTQEMWPGPFIAAEWDDGESWGLAEANGSGWFIAYGMTKERAESTSRAVNAYDDHIALLKRTREYLSEHTHDPYGHVRICQCVACVLDAAIKEKLKAAGVAL